MVMVIAGSRIHLGFYNIKSERMFGSIGVYLENPKTIVGENGTVTKESKEIAKKICGYKKVKHAGIIKSPPKHIGLGSTTQTLLSIAKYYSLKCKKPLSYKKAALLTGRGEVSGIGIHGFRLGGFLIDGGKRSLREKTPPPLLVRLPFPNAWRIALVIPYGKRGYNEKVERKIMLEVKATAREETALKKALLSKIIPGVLQGNLKIYGEGVSEIQSIMGRIFSPYQKGEYFSEETMKSVEILRKAGAFGVGQSSWGPLAYGFIKNTQTEDLIKKVTKELYKENLKADVIVTKARNRGAETKNSM